MAEQITRDVVNEAQSMGDPSPIDAPATTTTISSTGNCQAAPEAANIEPKASDDLLQSPLYAPIIEAPAADDTRLPDNVQVNDVKGSGEGVLSHEDVPTDVQNAAPEGVQSQPPEASDGAADELVNGDSGDYLAPDDGTRELAAAETSGGSDTEASRADSTDPTSEGPRRHLRSNSVKKPTSFKPVSVTKNFLAKSGASTPSARPTDRGGSPLGQPNSSSQQLARPRLVAKAGSGTSAPRSGLSKVNGAGGAPDASTVWNKNRPAPTPAAKSLTDEELKQQFGIHMATRLQADEASKDPKWADIEDDEDDWAPETVEWMDGTKSTLAQAENQAPSDEEKPKPAQREKPADSPKPALAMAQRPSATGGTKTILKPGSHTPVNQPKPGGLVLKGAPEKPTLVAKPAAPVPAKSPWAPLPPIDKVSPIAPSVQPLPQSRFSQRDPHGFDALPPAPSPAKEIAADDFSRSWREDRGTKELFNSQSGRYEPVNETRRGSARIDGGFRQPSVLQRPQQNQPGPAEPSAAFQTNRAGHAAEGGTWTRRRTSSNVSGGSGQMRRMSFSRPHEVLSMPSDPLQRRPSQQLNVGDAGRPPFPQGRTPFPEQGMPSVGQTMARGEQIPPDSARDRARPASPGDPIISTVAAGTDSQVPEPPLPLPEDPVVVQQRLMREKIERAKKEKERRKEEEEREEAARKERIKLKLAALGPPPDQKARAREASDLPKPGAQAETPSATSASLAQPELDQPPPPRDGPARPFIPESPTTAIPAIPTIPATITGEVTHYGLMKIHQPRYLNPPAPSPDSSSSHTFSRERPVLQKASSRSAQEIQSATQSAHSTQSTHSIHTNPSSSSTQSTRSREMAPQMDVQIASSALHHDPLVKAQAELRKGTAPLSHNFSLPLVSQAWKSNKRADAINPWAGSSGMAVSMATGGNVWGAPSHDRALGNGTFEKQQPLTQQHAIASSYTPPHLRGRSPEQLAKLQASQQQTAAPPSQNQDVADWSAVNRGPSKEQLAAVAKLNKSPPSSRSVSPKKPSPWDSTSRSRSPKQHQAQHVTVPSKATQAPTAPGPIGRPLTNSAARNGVQPKKYDTSVWTTLPGQLSVDEKAIAEKNRAERAELDKRIAAGEVFSYNPEIDVVFKKTGERRTKSPKTTDAQPVKTVEPQPDKAVEARSVEIIGAQPVKAIEPQTIKAVEPQPTKFTKTTWNNLPSTLAANEKITADKNRIALAEFDKLTAAGMRPSYMVDVQTNFKKIGGGKPKSPKTEVVVQYAKPTPDGETSATSAHQDEMAATISRPPKHEFTVVQPAPQSQAPHIIAGQRSSKFFPRSQDAQAPQPSPPSSKSASPPPPESRNHPAHGESSSAPKVNLPIPKAVVKLPPAPTPVPKPVQAPVRAQQTRLGSQPIVASLYWQERFGALLGNRTAQPVQALTSPPTQATAPANALAVSSASKPSIDVTSAQAQTTVSLPNHTSSPKAISLTDDTDAVISKPTEEDLHNDREFGSTPTVRLPKNPAVYAGLLALGPPPRPLLPHLRYSRPVEISTAQPVEFAPEVSMSAVSGLVLKIRLPGQEATKTCIMPRPQTSSIRYTNTKKTFTPRTSSSNQQNARARKPQGTFQPQGQSQTAAPRPQGQSNNVWAKPSKSASQGNRRNYGMVH
ncbi:hypothetical protein W97_00027 [Coniosporium apollinis CBS 100218]|uniref:Uncharacterized protein n=1 Tax=Coniosporium apollinis (strain CBS 100218) TaxID=1168221 RepID=R7YG07_CONA1|nr:uncharacterized protein W97_00027 [Coniosporium apollinis CBS 100218]EON60818.1 hypothetical protein W97_00027 [Coniosporium apollinis CBS 100218]